MRFKNFKKFAKHQQHQPKTFEKLANPLYEIGHATGLTADEWRKFATEEYPVGKFNHMKLTKERD